MTNILYDLTGKIDEKRVAILNPVKQPLYFRGGITLVKTPNS